MALSAERLRQELAPVLDGAGFLLPAAGDRYSRDWSGGNGAPVAVIRPQTPEAVSDAMALLHRLRQPVTVQGGMTGLVQGGLPRSGEVVISLERLNQIELLDEDAGTVRVQAGVPLQVVHEAAEKADLFFPVDTGARGSATIGGMISTNAGGNRVLRYGMMRNSVLGVEAVLPDGTIVSRLSGLVKDNAGYDLKHLFIGSEGTLGIVTRAVLQLQPRPTARETAIVRVGSLPEVIGLLKGCRRALGHSLGSFEVMWPGYHRYVTEDLGIARAPFEQKDGLLVLVEALAFGGADISEALMGAIAGFMEAVAGTDAVVARSGAEADAFWRIRDASGEAARAIAPAAGFDISLHLGAMADWVAEIQKELPAMGSGPLQLYGHLGDGNLHLVASCGSDLGLKERIIEAVHRSVGTRGGSISAEHGIGFAKKKHLGMTRSAAEITLMRKLKQAIDPVGLLNQGRVFDRRDTA
jgi:FAD/FMN-containing dehydrogenase